MDEATVDIDALAGPASVPRPSDRLAGKVCLVTGGGSGIGRATALRMALESASVVIAGRDPDKGEAVAEELRAKGAECVFTAADVTREADVAEWVAATLRRFGRLDAVFNNAGFQEQRAPLAERTAYCHTEFSYNNQSVAKLPIRFGADLDRWCKTYRKSLLLPRRTSATCALSRRTILPGGNPGRQTLAPAGSTRGGSGGDEWSEALREKGPEGGQRTVRAAP